MASMGRAEDSAGSLLSYEQVEHELKTPLTSIRSLTEILRDYPDLSPEERLLFLQRLVDENDRLVGIVERLLCQLLMVRALS